MGSCSKDTEGTTWITYYPQITLSGDIYMNWEAGQAFQDPGVTVIMNEQDVTEQMEVTSDMDLSNPKPGFYTINYSFTTPDGIVAAGKRYIGVYAASAPLAGYYATQGESNRNGAAFVGSNFFPIKVSADGSDYAVSDLLGGYYDQGRGYGANYALSGVLSVDAAGVVSLKSWKPCPGWPDNPVESFTPGTYDASSKTLHWIVGYAGTPFDIYITKL